MSLHVSEEMGFVCSLLIVLLGHFSTGKLMREVKN